MKPRLALILLPLALAAFCRGRCGEMVLHDTPPAARVARHLAGCGPARAPASGWPARLAQVQAPVQASAQPPDRQANGHPGRETRHIAGWTVHVSQELLATNAPATARALDLLKRQLEEIIRVVPPAAVEELKKVPLWLSPEYPGFGPKAEYHPDPQWLRDHGRDPAMAQAVEFTNVRIFEMETRRMPVFVLHELAHAYHHRVLGHDHPGVQTAYQKAKAGGKYEQVERRDANGRSRIDRAYALTDPQEYFAETTEAFFGVNDFFPFTREELKEHDPEMFALLEKLWKLPRAGTMPRLHAG